MAELGFESCWFGWSLPLYCPILTQLKIAGEEQAKVRAPLTFLRDTDPLALHLAAGWDDKCGWF